ncbi:aminotransferase class IV [Carboxylicivirga sp. A043]|uniref:aminotransferase class IV n=1 Tax=Carboxylicivirga litoralis TaxID=2816963 RepID=UPI0021CB156F|nr:aminotransferase class IV [Carboxylicivirga sp. A043]MCU4155823.1 aminotransferase class IV [Carboxylicivirga sp. A043]
MDRTLKSVAFFNDSIGDDEVCIYEVFRIEASTPLFIDEHLNRLANSIEIAGYQAIVNNNQLKNRLKMLYSANNISNGNIKIDFRFSDRDTYQFMAYFTTAKYPSEKEYNEGIKCTLQFSERHHPKAKIYNPDVRGKANTIIEQRHVYESILVNSDNCLTEGSRSNLFFIKDNCLITADDSLVLGGIMRKQVLSIAQEKNIVVEFRAINIDELDQMEAAFISGTSPRLLAINHIDKAEYNVKHPLLVELRKALDDKIQQQIAP